MGLQLCVRELRPPKRESWQRPLRSSLSTNAEMSGLPFKNAAICLCIYDTFAEFLGHFKRLLSDSLVIWNIVLTNMVKFNLLCEISLQRNLYKTTKYLSIISNISSFEKVTIKAKALMKWQSVYLWERYCSWKQVWNFMTFGHFLWHFMTKFQKFFFYDVVPTKSRLISCAMDETSTFTKRHISGWRDKHFLLLRKNLFASVLTIS